MRAAAANQLHDRKGWLYVLTIRFSETCVGGVVHWMGKLFSFCTQSPMKLKAPLSDLIIE